MKLILWTLCLALFLGLSAPFGIALVLASVVMPAAYQAAQDSCLPIGDEPGLPTPVTLSADTEILDCLPATGDVPPGADGVCPPSGSAAERGLKPHALRALRCVKQRFPWIRYMGGVGSRPSGYVSDHPRGLAIDFMIPAWNTRAGNARGWEVAHWLKAHAKELHVRYLIFDDRSWRAYNPSAGWRPYRYPGPRPNLPVTRHLNHVHLSVSS
jgi:hypothetical protein